MTNSNNTSDTSVIATIFGCFFGGFIMIIYVCVQYARAMQIGLKKFSFEFSKVISRNKNSMLEYNKFLEGRETIKVKDHSDFYSFRGTRFFNSFVGEIENISIPIETSYGLCAVLVANYNIIRQGVISPTFLSEARYNLLITYFMCDEVQLNKILSKNREIMFRHQHVLDYAYDDLYTILEFLKLYFLYLYSLEDPATARTLNPKKFYRFTETPLTSSPHPQNYSNQPTYPPYPQNYPNQPPYPQNYPQNYPTQPPYPQNYPQNYPTQPPYPQNYPNQSPYPPYPPQY